MEKMGRPPSKGSNNRLENTFPVDLPFFDGPGLTRIGPALATKRALWKGLRDITNRWTREAMNMELPVLNEVINKLSEEDLEKFSADLSPTLREDLMRHKWDIVWLATSKTMQELYRILEEVWPPFLEKVLKEKTEKLAGTETTSELYRDQLKNTNALLISALNEEFIRIAGEYNEKFPKEKWDKEKENKEVKAFIDRLSPTVIKKLAHSGKGYDFNKLWETLEWEWDKYWVAKELAPALELEPAPSLAVFPLRLSRELARQSIERLEDVQIVIDCILSDEWGAWGDPRKELRGHGLDKPVEENNPTIRNPDFCIPCNSFGSAGLGDEEFPRFKKTVGRRETKWWEVRSEEPPKENS